MLSISARLAVLALAVGFVAATVSPVTSKADAVRTEDVTLALAQSVSASLTGQRASDVYAPTGETIDMTLTVSASRL